jgi:cytochrome c5
MRRHVLCLCAVLIAACGQDPAPPATAGAAPADARLAKIYAQTCRACHGTPSSGAPQAGDRQAWAPRVAQGMPALLDHTVNGYKGMPPLGACMDCGEKEFDALIRFMAGLDG